MLILIIFLPDLSKDPNMYSSYTESLLSLWTTVRSCTKNLLTYPISIAFDPFRQFVIHFVLFWIGFIQNERVIFLTWSSYLKVLILFVFWPDLSKDPNMYSSYTESLLSLWTTVPSCTENLLTYPISIAFDPFRQFVIHFVLFLIGFIQNERVIF